MNSLQHANTKARMNEALIVYSADNVTDEFRSVSRAVKASKCLINRTVTRTQSYLSKWQVGKVTRRLNHSLCVAMVTY